MSLDVSAITGYVDENRDPLIAASVAGARSVSVLNLQTGYKSSGQINILSTDSDFQEDNGGRNANGTTTLSKRVLTVAAIKEEEDINVKALNKTYQQHNVKAGSHEDTLPFEQEYTELKAKKIAKKLEKAIWQGDTTNADANLNRFDGFLKIIDAASGVVDGNPDDVTSITAANIISVVDKIDELLPEDVEYSLDETDQDGAKIFCGTDIFKLYKKALKDANLFHASAKDGDKWEIELPHSTTRLCALPGLTGTNRLIAGQAKNFVVGTDLENEEEEFKIWYSQDSDVVMTKVAFKYGVQVAFPAEIVEFTVHTP